ncbi:MAG: hypothetical protein HY823_02495 [Acidobacteria bacterium]|nr:hypothetical protein [Acidobacteriota bacterium]
MTGEDRRLLEQARSAIVAGRGEEARRWLGPLLAGPSAPPEARLLELHARRLLGEGGIQEGLEALVAELEAGGPGEVPVLLEALRFKVIRAMAEEGHAEALQDLSRALDLDPDNPELHQARGALLAGRRRYAEARIHLEKAMPHRREDAHFWSSYGLVLQYLGEPSGAEDAFRRAMALDPGKVDPVMLLAQFLADSGRLLDAGPLLDRALELSPGMPAAVSGKLGTALYDPGRTPREVAGLHRAWTATLETRVQPLPDPPKDWDPDRPLTVAYLSPDFREHSCAHFIEPLLRAHDRTRHRFLLVHLAPSRDARTEVFEALADTWIEASALDDATLARRLREAGVDLLVDLAGHSGFNRLPLLALRPAPVQLEWLGYPFTTGLTRLEGRITDSLVDPPGSEALASEPLLRLDPCYLCWQPPEAGPAASPLPCLGGAPFTFGSFNHFAKLNAAVVETWSTILRRAAGSRLLLKGKGSQDPVLRERILEAFEAQGIRRGRVHLEGWSERPSTHLEHYRAVDLALDPFPYNGATTSLEALWMEVPFVALQGVHSLSRHGSMLLTQVGLPALIAPDPQAYVALAVALAGDPVRLASLRAGLRNSLLASPLCDAVGFARRMEALFRDQWRRACALRQG